MGQGRPGRCQWDHATVRDNPDFDFLGGGAGHAADPEVEETIKRTVQPYFVLQGNVCALLATKDHVNVFIYDPTVADPDGIINQGHRNATAKAVQIYCDDAINRAGGWRSIQALQPG